MHLDRLQRRPAVEEARRRRERVEHRARPRHDLDRRGSGPRSAARRCPASIADRDPARRDGRRRRAVDRAVLRVGGAREVEPHRRALDLDHDLERDRVRRDRRCRPSRRGRRSGRPGSSRSSVRTTASPWSNMRSTELRNVSRPWRSTTATSAAAPVRTPTTSALMSPATIFGTRRVGQHHAVDVVDELAALVELARRGRSCPPGRRRPCRCEYGSLPPMSSQWPLIAA